MDKASIPERHLPPGDDGAHFTYCRLCEAQCGLVAQVKDGRIMKVVPDREHVTSEGHLCVKGPGMLNVTYDPDRVLHPLRRTGAAGEFERVSWDEALDDIAQRLATILDRDGGSAAAVYGGNPVSFGTLHFAYIRQFLAAIGSTRIFNPMHVDTGAKHLASELVFGHGFRYVFPDLERCDFLLMLGANPLVSHMSLIAEPRAHRKLDEIAKRGAVVVVDPRRTETARRFEHLHVTPDSDAWLLGAVLRTVFDEALADTAYLEAHVDGWRELRQALAAFDIDTCAQRCGIPAETLRALARRFAGARTAACYGRLGTNRGRHSTLTSFFIEALNLVTGRFGRPGGAVIGQAPFEHPTAPVMPPAYGSRRSRIGDLPLIGGVEPGGALAAEIFTPGEGQVKALIVDSGNPVLGYPNSERTAQAFESLELMVALDFYVTESSRHAHYILPTTTFFERDDVTDSWTNNAPRPWLQAAPASVKPLGEARVEFDIYNALLQRMGRPPLFAALRAAGGAPPTLMQAADTLLRNGRYGDGFGEQPKGLTLERLLDNPHGLRLHENVDAEASWRRVAAPGGRARLWHGLVESEIGRLLASPTERDGAFPLRLFGRRKLRSLNSWMHNSAELVRSDTPTLLLHPTDAQRLGVADGQAVKMASRHGEVRVQVEVSDEVVPGSVNYPHGWGHRGGWTFANALPGVNINVLALDDPADWEPVSGMCLLDGIPVTVAPLR